MTETGLGGGVECEARNGYLLREADLLFEIVDFSAHRAGRQIRRDRLFDLTRRGMRLSVQNGRPGAFPAGKLPCGAVLRRWTRYERLAEPLRLSGGCTLSVTQLDEALLKEPSVCKYSRSSGRCAAATACASRQSNHGTLDRTSCRSCEQGAPHVFYAASAFGDHRRQRWIFYIGTLKRKISDLRNYE
jgi:hypothetical protein